MSLCNLLEIEKGDTPMAAKFRVTTQDLTIQFWEQSFSVIGRTIWTGRVIDEIEARKIADILQSHVCLKRDDLPYFRQRDCMVNDDFLVQENEALKQRLADLGEDI